MGLLRRLFGTKKQPVNSDVVPGSKLCAKKRRWSFGKSSKENCQLASPYSSRLNGLDSPSSSPGVFSESLEANKHAIAVAAATAAVAEAALAAAHAAAEVVRLTNGIGGARSTSSPHDTNSWRITTEVIAAVKIQSAFRGYLARRALRALKALVKLQALVKGHIVRKQTADMFRRMQSLVRLQSRLRAHRMHMAETSHSSKSSFSRYPGYGSKFEDSAVLKRCTSNSSFREVDSSGVQLDKNWLECWMEENLWTRTGHAGDDKNDKILEVDTWKPHLNPRLQINKPSRSSRHGLASDYDHNVNFADYNSPAKSSRKSINPSVYSKEVSSPSLDYPKGKEDVASRTGENSPAISSSSRAGGVARKTPFTPTRSECSSSFFNGYSGNPNYMANTKSSRAKSRSLSAPRQRLDFEKYGSTRMSLQGSWDGGNNSDRDKTHPTSSRFNRPGNSI